ncbi:hypothetical protein B4140_3950 [Bacillus amyloliquefaciens]|nr:hypothetical protein B4140_3950 [Bacillus amyloliquefaciens]
MRRGQNSFFEKRFSFLGIYFLGNVKSQAVKDLAFSFY